MAEVIIEKKKGLSPVWILPILAICLGGWLLFKSATEAGIDITVRVDDSSGIVANKTPVMYKGNQVGLVKEVNLRRDLQGVDLIIEMNKGAKPYLVEDMVFWIEKVDVQASRITGINTLLSGQYIGVRPGTSKKAARNFVAAERRPPVAPNAPGLHLKLRTNEFKSLGVGSGIYNQNIEIGSVQDYALQDDNSVLIDVYIEPKYKHLVKKGTRFWNASGITISGGIADLKVQVGSLSAILNGGVNIQTPARFLNSPPVENGHVFPLYSDLEALAGVDKPQGLHVILEAENLGSISIGNGVYYRKIKVGEVTKTELSKTFQKVLVEATIYKPFAAVIRENSKFWNASGVTVSGGVVSGLSISTESLQSFLAGGIALATPDNKDMGGAVSEGHHFTLYDKGEDAWRKWSPNLGPEEKPAAAKAK